MRFFYLNNNNNNKFLTINSRLYLDFISFSINVLLLFQDPTQASTLHLVVMFFLPFLICYGFSVFPCFSMTLTVSGSTGQVFCRMGWSVVFHMINWSYKFGERIPQRWSALLEPSGVCTHTISLAILIFIILSQWCLPNFSTVQLLFVPFPALSSFWNWVTKSNPLLGGRVIKLHLLHRLFRFFFEQTWKKSFIIYRTKMNPCRSFKITTTLCFFLH